MNFPGTLSDANWTWRSDADALTDALAGKIRSLTKLYGRLAQAEETHAVIKEN